MSNPSLEFEAVHQEYTVSSGIYVFKNSLK